ncbi:MAG: glycosyltransferase family 2 protein [Pseudomonadota bacterium]
MPLPLSVFVITLNEAARLGATLDAVRPWAGEIVVVDSGSTDATVEIARAHGARVFHRDWSGFGQQKRFAEDQCTHDWLLNLDADEIVTADLAAEIAELFSSDAPDPALFNVRILNVYPGSLRPRPFASDYNVVRLYHRSQGRYRDHAVYDRIEPEAGATVRQLRGALHHFPVVDIAQMVHKGNRHSGHAIERLAKRPRWQLKLRLPVQFPWSFLQFYLFRGHIFGGWKGFAFALNGAFMRTMRIAKALEYREKLAADVNRAGPPTAKAG